MEWSLECAGRPVQPAVPASSTRHRAAHLSGSQAGTGRHTPWGSENIREHQRTSVTIILHTEQWRLVVLIIESEIEGDNTTLQVEERKKVTQNTALDVDIVDR